MLHLVPKNFMDEYFMADGGADGNNNRAPDSSAVRANARIEKHEEVCAERYRGILAGQQMLAAQLGALQSVVDSRFNTISNRMWGAAVAGCMLLIGALGSIVFYLLTKGQP